MLQVIHKYKRTLVGFIFLFLLCVSLSGFGLDALRTFNSGSGDYAIKIDDETVTFRDVAQARRNAKESAQQTVDHIIAARLIERDARQHDLAVGQDRVREILERDLFPTGFDATMYSAFLRQMGMTAAQFESTLLSEALRAEYTQLMQDIALPSTREARSALVRLETEYAVKYVEFDPAAFLSAAPAPTQEQIEQYYSEHSADYEVPAGVSYDYVLFKPEQYEKSVEVAPEDVEFYYTENESDFALPETVKARHIRLLYAKEATPEQMAELKEKANQILSRAKAGEAWDALVLEFSDDLGTKNNGGDLGWLTRGKMSNEFDAQAFKSKAAGITDLVAADYGFQIVKVDEYKAPSVKPLAEVRDQIVQAIQKREAPTYAANRAAELFEQWKKSGTPLAAFSAQHGLSAVSSKGILTESTDPEDQAKGLTKEILQNTVDKQQIVDVGEHAAIVEVKEFRETDIAALKTVQDKVVQSLRQLAAERLSREAAQTALTKAKDGSYADMSALAKDLKLTLQESKGLSQQKRDHALFANPKVEKFVFAQASPNAKPSEVFTIGSKSYLVVVSDIKAPEQKIVDERIEKFKNNEAQRLAATLLQSRINQLKRTSEIAVNPQVLAEG